ncbi:MAG: prolyl oligopeptidase family serine peptidase [Pseudomonadota bacterium]
MPIAEFSPQNGSMQDLNLPFTNFSGLRIIRDHEGNRGTRFVAIASHTSQFAQIIAIDNAQYRVLRASPPLALDQDDVAKAQAITFATGDDALPLSQWPDAALCAPKYPLPTQAQAFFYLPTNTRFALSEGEKPPLIVKCHGGPTGCSDASLHLKTQFFTSRGFAVLDVNYRGSTGFGRAYREALYGQWGIVDVQDCVAGAAHLIRTGQVDGRRTIITGSSAGGYTVLSALAFADIFRAGCSAYGIGDLQALAQDTHKFESRYLDQLLGPYPAEKTRYHARSPQYHAHKIACPVLFLQGGKDKIVPPQQAQEMCKALEDADQNAKLVLFAGEGHGFRQEQSIHDALLHELWFYADCFGFRAYDRRPQ